MAINLRRVFPNREMVVGAAVLAAVLFLLSGFQSTYSSCHLCRNRRRVDSPTWLGVSVWPGEIRETDFPATHDHRHIWMKYRYRSTGPLWLAEVSCSDHVYRDGGAAPDGMR